jgi:hypothetical protein
MVQKEEYAEEKDVEGMRMDLKKEEYQQRFG